jgi:hypothetical protein
LLHLRFVCCRILILCWFAVFVACLCNFWYGFNVVRLSPLFLG